MGGAKAELINEPFLLPSFLPSSKQKIFYPGFPKQMAGMLTKIDLIWVQLLIGQPNLQTAHI